MTEVDRPVTRRHHPRSFIFPLLLIALGVFFLLNNLGLLADNAWETLLNFWPLLLVAMGVDSLIKREGAAGPALMIGLGIIFQLNNFGVLSVGVWDLILRLWPLLLVAWGFDLIFGRRSVWLSLIGAIVVLILLAGALALQGVVQPALQGEIFQEGASTASSAQVILEPAVGQLTVDGADTGADLISGRIVMPGDMEVDRNVSQEGGRTVVSLRTRGGTPFRFGGPNRWEWDLGLSQQVPIALQVNMGAGDVNLDLRQVELTGLDVEMGVGQTTIYLPGEGSYDVRVNSAIGQLRIFLPEGLEARIRVDRGISALDLPAGFREQGQNLYVSEGYAEAENRVNLDVSQAIGNLDVNVE